MWPTSAAWWPNRTSSITLPPVRIASIQFRTCARVESSSQITQGQVVSKVLPSGDTRYGILAVGVFPAPLRPLSGGFPP